jgi:hypothetical protein
MIIKPSKSFTDNSLPANFPAALILFHADDYVSGSTTWASRVGNLTATLSAGCLKDADGVYGVGNVTVSSVSGTMPTLGEYCAVFGVGKTRTNSATLGLVVQIGDTAEGQGVGNANTYTASGTSETADTATTGNPTTVNSHACRIGYYEIADTSSPVVYAVLANDLNEPIGSVTDAGPVGGFTVAQLGAAISALHPLLATTHAGSRIKLFGIMQFATAKTLNQLKNDAADMAHTQQLCASWINNP